MNVYFIQHCLYNDVPCSVWFTLYTGAKNADQSEGNAKREVKPGQITESDSWFNELSKHIGEKYSDIGYELGLGFDCLQNELESGIYKMKQADEKAMKMLQLWKKSATKKFTYAVLAAALEKYGLKHYAEQYCYTTQMFQNT